MFVLNLQKYFEFLPLLLVYNLPLSLLAGFVVDTLAIFQCQAVIIFQVADGADVNHFSALLHLMPYYSIQK